MTPDRPQGRAVPPYSRRHARSERSLQGDRPAHSLSGALPTQPDEARRIGHSLPGGGADALLVGAVDLHVHGGPDVVPRRHTDVELARRAQAAGMRAIVLKNHHESTVGRAADVATATGFLVFGGITLNAFASGGIDPDVVEASLALGARVVWMPTLGSAAHAAVFGRGRQSWLDRGRPAAVISARLPAQALDLADRATRRVADKICRLVRRADALLASGHLSAAELIALAAIAGRVGTRMLVTHPDYRVPGLSIVEQVALAREIPGVVFERCAYVSSLGYDGAVPAARVADAVRATGVERNVVSSDLGQPSNPAYPDGLAGFAQAMVDGGLRARDIDTMLRAIPARLLALQAV